MIPQIVTDMKIKNVEIEVGDKSIKQGNVKAGLKDQVTNTKSSIKTKLESQFI